MSIKCRICGKEFEKVQYGHEYYDICSSECFDKNFWLEKVKNLSDERYVVLNDELHWVGDEDTVDSFRGFDGALYFIKKPDGTVVRTTNLWYNGKIPADIRDKFPENSKKLPFNYEGSYVIYTRGEVVCKQ